MFLNESYLYEADDAADVKSSDFSELEGEMQESGSYITADLATFAEAMYFAEKAWNNLSMKMVRLEHTAIVNNDSRLMSEGIRDMASRAAEWFKEMWNKIKAFVDRLIKRVEDMFDNRNLKRFASVVASYQSGGTIPKRAWITFDHAQKISGTLKAHAGKLTTDDGNLNIDLVSNLEKLSDKKGTSDTATVDLTKPMVASAYKYVSGGRREILRAIETGRKAAQTTANAGIKAANSAKDNATVSKERAKLTKINAYLSAGAKILNAANSGALRILSAAARAGRQTNQESSGVLDSFF